MTRAEAPAGGAPGAREIRRVLAASLAIVAVTAIFSVTFFHDDEHYQVLELTGLKLGRTTPAAMMWEYHERMRPWLQPAAYYVVARAAMAFGVRGPFAQAFVFRLASGALAWAAMARLVRTQMRWSDDEGVRRTQLRVTALLGFFPYLAVRTSSENASCALVTMAFTVVVDALRGRGTVLPWRAALAAGALFGLAFECRFQTALLAAGLVAWLVAFRRVGGRGAAAFAASGAAALALGALVDRWGYGAWTFPAAQYLRVNLVDRAAQKFGTDPFFGYLYLLPANVFAPVVVLLMTALGLAWLRRPMHPVTWTTLPYALVHCALAHKEERFFFPIVLLATSSLTLGLAPGARHAALPALLERAAAGADRVAARLWARRRSPAARLVVADSAVFMVLLAVYPLGWSSNLSFYAAANRDVEPNACVWKLPTWSFPDYPFYRGDWRVCDLTPSATSGPGEAVARGEPAYFVAPLPYDEPDPRLLHARPVLVASEFPGWRWAPVRAALGPALRRLRSALDPIAIVPKARWLTLYRLESAPARAAP